MRESGDLGDDALVEAARAGDRRAYERLVEPRLAATFDQVLARVGDRARALDVTGAAVLRAWSDLAACPRGADFGRWLGRVAAAEASARRSPVPTGATDLRQLWHVIRVRLATEPQRGRWQIASDRFLPHPRLPLAGRVRRALHSVAPGRLGLSARRGGLAAAALVVLAGGAVAIATGALPLSTPSRARGPAATAAAPRPSPTGIGSRGAAAPAMAAGSGLLAFSSGHDIWVSRPDGTEAHVLVHLDGLRLSAPSWSPTGDRLLFVSDEPAVLVLDLATLAVRRVSGGDTAVWSPDGRQVAVPNPLRVVDVATGAVRSLNSTDDASLYGRVLAWSPDGQWLVVEELFHTPRASGPASIVRLSLTTAEPFPLVQLSSIGDLHAEWSHHSTRLAVSANTGGSWSIHLMDADGGNVRELVSGEANLWTFHWAPDNSQIAYVAETLGPMSLNVVALDGSAPTDVAAGVGPDIAWTPAGDGVVYMDEAPWGEPSQAYVWNQRGVRRRLPIKLDMGTGSIAASGPSVVSAGPTLAAGSASPASPRPSFLMLPPQGGQPADPAAHWGGLGGVDRNGGCDPYVIEWSGVLRPVTALGVQPGRDCAAGGWSPDGHGFLVTSGGVAKVIRRDGSSEPVAVGDPGWAQMALWSPRGGRITVDMCVSQDDCATPRTLIVSNGGSLMREVPGPAAWSPDESYLAVQLPDGDLAVGDGDGADLRPIGRFPMPSGWAPDGSAFLFIRDGQAWRVGSDGARVRQVSDFPYGGATSASWSPDGSHVAVVEGASTVWIYGLYNSSRRVVDLGSDWAGVTWAPDGRSLGVLGYAGGAPHLWLVQLGIDDVVDFDYGTSAVWSPDGRFLALAFAYPSGLIETAVTDAYGSGRVEVLADTTVQPQAWLP